VGRNGVEVGGLRVVGQVSSGAARLVDQLLEEEMGALGTLDLEDGVEGVDPFASLQRIDVL
jgi:hypothetical protein